MISEKYQVSFAQQTNHNTQSNLFDQMSQQQQPQQRPPNILLIVGDDFGYADIGSFGSQISTPNLDTLAKEGKILTNYHTNPVCSPARVSLLTGVDHHIGGIGTMAETIVPNQIDKPGYETYINNNVVTVAELLRDGGYHTYMSGKWHLSGTHDQNGTLPSDRGFEKSLTLLGGGATHFKSFPSPPVEKVTFAEDGKIIPRPGNDTTYSNDLYADKMIRYIKNDSSDGKPFFAYLSFQVAHSPFQAKEGTIAKYDKIYNVGWDELRKQTFEKQKGLGFWPANMPLPERIPPNQPWTELTQEQKDYAIRILATHAAMIEDMDHAIGKVIQVLKETGQYDNTLIIFISDNGSSDPSPMLNIPSSTRTDSPMAVYLRTVNNSLSNIGNASSIINYGAWGSFSTISPLSGYKTTEYEGGTRAPFVIKEPVSSPSSNSSSSNSMVSTNQKIIKAFTFVNDLTPTILDYAGIKHPGITYNGHPVHPIMGKSLKPLLNGTVDRVYGKDEIVADEMFNNSAVYMGDWKATKHMPPVGDGKWQLFNLTNDPGQNHDVSSQHQDILQKMIVGYDSYAKDVGVVPPLGQKFYNLLLVSTPPLNQSQVTIDSKNISPANFTNPIQSTNASQIQNTNASEIPSQEEIQSLLDS